MNIAQRVQKLENATNMRKGDDIFIHLEGEDTVTRSHNGTTTELTLAEFERIKAESQKLGHKWIVLGPDVRENEEA